MRFVKLNSICTFKQWKTLPIKELLPIGYPVYGANGIIGYSSSYNHTTPTLMICCRGATCGAINSSFGKCYINGNAMALDNLSSEFDFDYVRMFLKHFDFSKIVTGAAQPQITQIGLSTIQIPKPSLEQQRHISKQLLHFETLINVKYTEISDLESLVKSRFIEMFGDPILNDKNWPTSTMSDCCQMKGTKSIPHKEKYWLLNLDKIKSETGEILGKDYVVRDEVGSSTFFFDKNYVLYSKLRPYLNKVIISDESGFATSELVPLKPSACLDSYYLAFLLRSKSFVNWIDSTSFGAKMPRASISALRSFRVPLPPLELQNKFADFVHLIDKSRFVVQKEIKDLQELLDSKMDEYFGGEE